MTDNPFDVGGGVALVIAVNCARQSRRVDGATEVHQQVLARHFMEERREFWRCA